MNSSLALANYSGQVTTPLVAAPVQGQQFQSILFKLLDSNFTDPTTTIQPVLEMSPDGGVTWAAVSQQGAWVGGPSPSRGRFIAYSPGPNDPVFTHARCTFQIAGVVNFGVNNQAS